MSGHAASNAVVTVLLSLMLFFRFLDVCLRFLAWYLEIERFEGL